MFTRKTDQRPVLPMSSAQHPSMSPASPPAIIDLSADAAPPPLPSHQNGATNASAETDAAQSVIGQDLTIEGQSITIRCRGALHINGNIQAELHSRRLVVGESGKVEGTISADQIDVWGRVSGSIMGARVVLHSGAEVEGDIHSKSLSVEDGASFEGRSRKVTDASLIAPQLDTTGPIIRDGAPTTVPIPLQ